MHRVVRNHLTAFEKKFSLDEDQSENFEAFVNFAVFKAMSSDNVDPNNLIYDGADPGIDGVMVFIEDTYVSSEEEVLDAFAGRKRDVEVTIIFTQSKTSETWSKAEINTFESGIKDFLAEDTSYPQSDYMENAKLVFGTVIGKVGKIKGGKPNAQLYFATTARETHDAEIIAAKSALRRAVQESGYFSKTEAHLLNRDSLIDLWDQSQATVEATLPVLDHAAFPVAPGISQGYVVTVKAKDFIDQLLEDKNDRLRQRIFEENVRDFIGLEGDVNNEMSVTLSDVTKQKRFGILNNGVTIISPDVRVSGFKIFLKDFQIVNGCQTSNVLFEHRLRVSDDATLMLKIVETDEPEVVDDIVRSTNRQAKVGEDQFLATLDAVKAIERYFEARGTDESKKLYFERRKNQYAGNEEAKALRIFDVKEVARCVGAMFFDRPELASRYPNRLTGEMRSLIFNKNYDEEVFYIAAYTYYRLRLLFGSKIEAKYMKLRWHILMAIKYYVCGENFPQLNSNKVKRKLSDIEKFMAKTDDKTIAKIKTLCAAIVEINEMTRDKIKSPSLAVDIKEKALDLREG
ncbi:AIPR family protein [Methylorubrum thiocyanatum]|uniref:AIPR family protein n=1 Tax=Methylorubrum thiocyanatum TaxID=47958 RepID=UPI0035C7DDB1